MQNGIRIELEHCLLRNGFNRQEIRKYLKSIKDEEKAISTSHLFVNGGIRRYVRINEEERIEV